MKRIAIPCENGQVCEHFGHAPEFVFFDADPDTGEIRGEYHLSPPVHQPGVLPAWIAEQRANVLLAGGIGGRARALFNQHGVDVVAGVAAGDARATVEAYLKGTLVTGENACDHGQGHG